jgi:hypothetical protein
MTGNGTRTLYYLSSMTAIVSIESWNINGTTTHAKFVVVPDYDQSLPKHGLYYFAHN